MNRIIICTLCLLLFTACGKEDQSTPDTATVNLPDGLESWANVFDGEGVGAALDLGGVNILFSLSGRRYAWFENGIIYGERDLKAPDSHFKDLAFDDVGAAAILGPNSTTKNAIVFANESGDNYTLGNIKNNLLVYGQFNNPDLFEFASQTIGFYDWSRETTFPFAGVTALCKYSYYFRDGYKSRVYIQNDGRFFTELIDNRDDFETPSASVKLQLRNVGIVDHDENLNMPAIGAMTKIGIDYVVFSLDGKHFKVSTHYFGLASELYSLY